MEIKHPGSEPAARGPEQWFTGRMLKQKLAAAADRYAANSEREGVSPVTDSLNSSSPAPPSANSGPASNNIS